MHHIAQTPTVLVKKVTTVKEDANMTIHGSSRGRGHVWLILLAVLGAALVSLLALARWDSPARAIVGGTPVPDGKYPFIAQLLVLNSPGYVECSGTLIDPD